MGQLVRYEQARHALQLAHSVDEVKDIRDKAQAMAAYARQANDTQLVEWATEIKVRAERKAGQMLAETVQHGGDRKSESASKSQAATLTDLGINKSQSSRWQKLAAVPEDKFEQAVAAAKEVAGEVTTAAMLRINQPHVANNSGENEWYTPPEFIELARRSMGGIDCDPASNELANRTVKAATFFTAKQDGLVQKWSGRVWMNPPYAQPLCANFCAALTEKFITGEIKQACVLVNNATETVWFQTMLEHASAACFLKGRIKYHDRTGKPANTPLQGQVVLYFGERVTDFHSNFSEAGITLIHV